MSAGAPIPPGEKKPAPPATAAQMRPARVLRNVEPAKLQPLYPASRLLKGAVLEADRTLADAGRVLADARQQAAAIKGAAQAEADSVRRAAFERGAAEAAAEFAELLKRLDAEIGRLQQSYARDVQRVAFRFARAVLDVEFQARPDRVADLAATLLKPARLYNQVTLHLHPADVELVRSRHDQLLKQLAFAKEIHFTADESLPPHGVRVETEMGLYDGSVETQLRRLEAHVLTGEKEPGGTV